MRRKAAIPFGKGPTEKDPPGHLAGGFDNALLSKLPILAVRQRQLVWPPKPFDGSEPSEARSVVFAKFQGATGPVWIGSTHLPRGEANTRANAVQRLVAITRELNGQWLLVGDFNMPADSWLNMHPALRSYPEPSEPTHPIKDPVEPIDYCVARQELQIHAEVLREAGSDHLPIFAACRLQ